MPARTDGCKERFDRRSYGLAEFIFVVPKKLHFRDLAELRSRYWNGEPDTRIGRALGVHASVVRRLIKERGLRVRSQIEINQLLADEKTDAEHCARTALMRAAKAAKARLRTS